MSIRRQPDEALRLPPGNLPTQFFPVVHVGSVPPVNLSAWTLSIFGEVPKHVEMRWGDILRLPRATMTIDLHCVEGWSVIGSEWTGVRLSDVLSPVDLHDEASYIMLHCDGGYTTGLPLALAEQVLLAFGRDGVDLSPEHGFPLRAVVRDRYAWKSAKWIRGIELMPAERFGYREWYGYDNDADPWRE